MQNVPRTRVYISQHRLRGDIIEKGFTKYIYRYFADHAEQSTEDNHRQRDIHHQSMCTTKPKLSKSKTTLN